MSQLHAAVRALAPTKGLLERVTSVPLALAHDFFPTHEYNGQAASGEEFRALRTRLNHMQGQQKLHTLLVTSPAAGEGKSFAAMNLAMAEAQLDHNLTLLCDFDLRRPVIHHAFGISRSPGLSDYLRGQVGLPEAMHRIADMNLYVLTAGEAVENPLELLHVEPVKQLFEQLPNVFQWVIVDSPPLLFAADANMLSTLCDGTILVARVGETGVESIGHAVDSLCQNNVLGIVVNGVRGNQVYRKQRGY